MFDLDHPYCEACGGNHDGPHPRLCLACAYEAHTRRSFERAVDNKLIAVENGRIIKLQEQPHAT
jgi:hypothetical protein